MILNIAEQFMKGMVKNILVYKNSGEILNKLKSRGFLASSLSTCHRLDLDCKRSKKGMLLFLYVIYSPLS